MTTSILELDNVIRRYAWSILKKRCNFLRRWLLDEKEYVCEVDWAALTFEHKLSRFESREVDNTSIDTNWGTVVTGSRWVPLWSCDFDNNADMKQSHTFRGTRNTTSWVDVDVTQCYTVNKEVNLQVNLPPNMSRLTAGRDNSFTLAKVRGQIYKDVLTWEVNSQVEILPGWRAHAELLAREECRSMEFEIRTTLYNPKGILPVRFKRKSDMRTMYLVEVDNFRNAFTMLEEEGGLKPQEKTCLEVMIERTLSSDGQQTTSTCHPQLVTRGTCVCVTWSDQKVDIATSPLSGGTVTASLDLGLDGQNADDDGGTPFGSSDRLDNKWSGLHPQRKINGIVVTANHKSEVSLRGAESTDSILANNNLAEELSVSKSRSGGGKGVDGIKGEAQSGEVTLTN